MSEHAYAIAKDLQSEEVSLEQLYLDPNNPRFVGSDWQDVPEEDICNVTVQEQAAQLLKAKYDIEKLRANMEVNGYLPIDRIIIRKLNGEAYLVLEGNRRICAAKELQRVAARDPEIPDDVRDSGRSIPCLLYTGDDPQAAWTFQGLRHITGIRDWPAFNKAKLLVTQMQDEGLNLTQVGQRFGLTPFGAGQWVRGYYAFLQAANESDYTEELDEKAYLYFQELFSRSSIPIREWMDWEDDNFRFRNTLRFNEFVGWLYPKPEDPEVDGNLGIWENRRLLIGADLRRLSYVLRNEKEVFEEFRRGNITVEGVYSRVLSKQYDQSVDRQQEVYNSISTCVKALDNLPFKMLREAELKDRLIQGLTGLKDSIQAIEDTMN